MPTADLTETLDTMCITGGDLKVRLAALEPKPFAHGAFGRAKQAIDQLGSPETKQCAADYLEHFGGFPLVQFALAAVIAREWISKVDFEHLTALWREHVGPIPT